MTIPSASESHLYRHKAGVPQEKDHYVSAMRQGLLDELKTASDQARCAC